MLFKVNIRWSELVISLVVALMFGMLIGSKISKTYTTVKFQDAAIKAGVAHMVISSPYSRETVFAFKTNSLVLP
jgi:hypothetical protein